MKVRFFFLLLLVTGFGFSQSVNDYKAVILPLKFDFMKSENQFRLATFSKFNLKKAGFEAFYNNEAVTSGYNDRCSLLYFDVLSEKSFLTTKLHILFKDCYGKVIFQSATGVSREKNYQTAYSEALNDAFKSVYALQYKYNGNDEASKLSQEGIKAVPDAGQVPAVKPNVVVGSSNPNLLYAQPMSNGFQLVDSSTKVVMKVFKTSNASCYIAAKGENQGVLILKENQWFYEYYQNENLISEKIEVKF